MHSHSEQAVAAPVGLWAGRGEGEHIPDTTANTEKQGSSECSSYSTQRGWYVANLSTVQPFQWLQVAAGTGEAAGKKEAEQTQHR